MRISAKNSKASRSLSDNYKSRQNTANPNIGRIFFIQPASCYVQSPISHSGIKIKAKAGVRKNGTETENITGLTKMQIHRVK